MILRRGLCATIAATAIAGSLLATAAQSATLQPGTGVESTPVVAHPTPMPTVDRLAQPPTVENPTQADEGAQVYWLNCQPCHGDRGQGLTDEWRAQYPEDHQNCWTSGCHGDNPYENGFTLPTGVPPVSSPGSLQRFEHMGLVLSYISTTMPYNAPGSLQEEEYLALAAFLAREHGLGDGSPLRQDNAAALRLRPAASATPVVAAPPGAPEQPASGPAAHWYLLPVAVIILLALARGLWRRRRRA